MKHSAEQAQIFDLPFFGPEFRTAWENWLQYRKERKLAKYVPTGLKGTFSKLIKDSHNNEQKAIKIIENAISCNWQGLHGLKEEIEVGSNISPKHNSINTNQFMRRPKAPEVKPMTDEEMMEWIESKKKTDTPILYIPLEFFDFLEKKGVFVVTEKQWDWCLRRAVSMRRTIIAGDIKAGTMPEGYLDTFKEMETSGLFTGNEPHLLKNLAKKIATAEYLKK